MDMQDLERRFSYHAPKDELTKDRHQHVRNAAHMLALQLDGLMLDCREKSLAVTALEEFMFWANAGIARQGSGES